VTHRRIFWRFKFCICRSI